MREFKSARRVRKKLAGGGHSNAILLFMLPFPLLAAAIVSLGKGAILNLVITGGAFAVSLYAAVLARQGLANEAEYNRRKVTKPPRFPLKILAALLTGGSCVAVAGYAAGYPLVAALAFGVGAVLAFYLLYGFDPRKEKVVRATQGVTTEEVLRILGEARQAIAGIQDANEKIRNREFTDRLYHITDLAEQILQQIEENPRDLRRARKFLTVYLEGAHRVTEGYARTHRDDDSGELEENFRRVLGSMEQVFDEQNRKLREHDVIDLDVRIEVLRTQLEREGVI